MPIASEKGPKMINYNDFKVKMYELCDKNEQNHPSLNELVYFFEKYSATYNYYYTKGQIQYRLIYIYADIHL